MAPTNGGGGQFYYGQQQQQPSDYSNAAYYNGGWLQAGASVVPSTTAVAVEVQDDVPLVTGSQKQM